MNRFLLDMPVCRIRLQTRIKNNPEVWDYEGLQIIPDQRQVFLEGKEILLTRTEFDIVYYLAAQNGRAVPYQELYEAVWQREYLPDHGGRSDSSCMAITWYQMEGRVRIFHLIRKLEKENIQSFSVSPEGICSVREKNGYRRVGALRAFPYREMHT